MSSCNYLKILIRLNGQNLIIEEFNIMDISLNMAEIRLIKIRNFREVGMSAWLPV
jgi:hypothetical protein